MCTHVPSSYRSSFQEYIKMDKPEREGLKQPGTEENVAKAARAHLAAGGGGLFLGNILI